MKNNNLANHKLISFLILLQGIHSLCEVKLLVAKHLNFEAASSHDITIRVFDQNGYFNTSFFTINIVDVNDVPIVSKGWRERERHRERQRER